MDHLQYDFMLCAPANDDDIRTAQTLAASIQKYRLPRGAFHQVQGAGYTRVCTFFGAQWDDALRQQLEDCRFLVVLCTPRTHASPVIAQMLAHFATLGRKANIIAVLAEGEPVEAFPPFFIEEKQVPHMLADGSVELCTETIEPVASDLRAQTAGEARRRLAYETVRIVAALIGIHPDVLERRHEKRRKRRLTTLLSAAGALALVVAAVFGYFGLQALREGDIARRQTELGAQMATRIFTELPSLFTEIPDADSYVDSALLDSVDALLGGDSANLDAIDLAAALTPADDDNATTLIRKGALWRRAGQPEKALELYRQGFTGAGLDASLLDPFMARIQALTATDQSPDGTLYYLFRDNGDSGLLPGDMLVALDGQYFDTYQHYYSLLNAALPGAQIELSLLREDIGGGFRLHTLSLPREAFTTLMVMGV